MLQLLYNAQIHTMRPASPRAQAAVWDDGRFVFVGSLENARHWLGDKPHRAVDAMGHTVLPGFNDAHLHLLHTALRTANVDLTQADSIETVVGRLRDAAEHRTGEWLIGEGWLQDRFQEARMLVRSDLDRVSADIPIAASRACGHIMTVNSRALSMLGLQSAFPDGILREDEQGAVWACLPSPSVDAMLQSLTQAQHALFAQGITSVQSDDLGSMSAPDAGGFLRAVCAAGNDERLLLRYSEQALLPDEARMQSFFADNLHTLRGDRFHVSCVKLLLDGSLGARTAWLRAPYADDPATCGLSLYDDDTLFSLVREAAVHGLPCAIHVIGDAAMQQALDAFAAEGRGLRQALVHAQITDRKQLAQCGALGLSILAQPVFLQADAPIVHVRVGDALADASYGWRTMLGAGAHVAFSTDCPVEPFDPMPNLYHAITRKSAADQAAYNPWEAFALDEALYAYTAAGAYVSGMEREKSGICPGMLADFVVLDRALDPQCPEMLLETKVAYTYIGGKCVYSA